MFQKFRQRSHELERLDTGDYTPDEYARWQREMSLIHGVWGEKRALEHSLIREIRDEAPGRVSILDVGAGTGGILKLIKDMLADIETFLVAGETSREALNAVRVASATTGIVPLECDALSLPFTDDSFDYVICTLMLHHLTDTDAEVLMKEMRRVAQRRFFIVDLNRHPVGYYAYRLVSPFLLQPFTQQDGALSILRSFTPSEMLALAHSAGVQEASVTHSRANRLILSGK
ncbi:MAG TPA: methyltransferase domain-containing protein [Pyrinomonadaceae bacterium]|jgi:ubiquinone/menaquinone biosynthesis C-methylase UbiE|nr:methyltransferase domain-containing protein [Pyrinomonadaceae bacterium]